MPKRNLAVGSPWDASWAYFCRLGKLSGRVRKKARNCGFGVPATWPSQVFDPRSAHTLSSNAAAAT